MGRRLLDLRSGSDSLLRLPVPNHGLDGVERSVESSGSDIDRRAEKRSHLSDTVNSRLFSQSCSRLD